MSKANYRSTHRCWVRGNMTVGTFNGQDGVYLHYPLVPINGFIIGKCKLVLIKSQLDGIDDHYD